MGTALLWSGRGSAASVGSAGSVKHPCSQKRGWGSPASCSQPVLTAFTNWDLPVSVLRSLSLPSPLLSHVPGACCGVRWDPARHGAQGAAALVAARLGQNRKICFASPGTGRPQQLHQPHLTADPSGAHAGEKPAGNSLPDWETKPALLPARSQRASLLCPSKFTSPCSPCINAGLDCVAVGT